MGAIENIKEIADLVKKIGDMDLYRKIVELEQEVFEVSRQNLKHQTEIEKLKELLSIKQKINYVKPLYYIEGDKNPYCPKCWEVDKILVHLIESASPTHVRCPNCEKSFKKG